MNKSDAIAILLKNVYSNNSDLILSEIDIKKLNEFFKEIENFDKSFEDFCNEHEFEINKISKLRSGKYEIEKQYMQSKALQPGILSECNYVETLASIFKLNKCLDFDRTPLNLVPIECRQYLNSGYQTFSSARYLYYSTSNPNIFIFQYGNPASGDAEIVINGIKLRVEFKERNAKTGEYDITGLYDDSGRLLISEEFSANTPEYIPLINKFNSETNVIDQIGHNYSDFDDETKIASIMEYFTRHSIDVIVSSSQDNELIVLTPDCIRYELPDGRKVISTENSEIRTSGRNSTKIFTHKLFQDVLNNMDAVKIDDGLYQVSLNNPYVEIVNARGSNKPSRVKFNKIFYVDLVNANVDGEKVIFSIADVKQLKPSISMHITINANKSELKQIFKDYFN